MLAEECTFESQSHSIKKPLQIQSLSVLGVMMGC